MNSFTGLLTLLLLSTITIVAGQLTVQSDWVFPQSPDYSTSVSIGSNVYFTWTSNLKNQFAAYLPNGNVSHVDVWVTGETISKGYHKLAANFDVASTQSFQWTVMVPSTELEEESVWVLRFIALDDDPSDLEYQVSSPLFQIVDNTKSKIASTSSSSTSVSSTSTTSSSSLSSSSSASSTSTSSTTSQTPQINATMTSTFSTSTTTSEASIAPTTETTTTPTLSISTPAETSPAPSPAKVLSTGAKVGIAIGASAAAVCICGLLLCLYSRNRRLRSMQSHGRVRMTDAGSLPPMEIQPDVSYASKGKA